MPGPEAVTGPDGRQADDPERVQAARRYGVGRLAFHVVAIAILSFLVGVA